MPPRPGEFAVRPTICSVIALQRLSGKSDAETLSALKRQDPKACATCEVGVQTWALLAGAKSLGLLCGLVVHPRVGTDDKLTPSSLKNLLPKFNGFVFVEGHVMPSVKGTVSNINGYGKAPITLLVTTSGKKPKKKTTRRTH